MKENQDPVELPIDGVLDLHTFRPSEIKNLIPDYLTKCRERKIYRVIIIHGKGIGLQRERVCSILREIPEVNSFKTASQAEGGWGATVAFLLPVEKNK